MSTLRSSALQKMLCLWLLLLRLFGVTDVVFSFVLFVPRPCNHNQPRTITSSLSLSSFQDDNNNNGDGTIIQVFDNVFSQETCQELLHPLAVDHADRCTSSVFYRNNKNNGDNNKSTIVTPLEVTLNRLLTALEEHDNKFNNNNNLNNSKTNRVTAVEYWSRQEHLHMDVHCDVDEGQLEQEGTLRYPSYSHVLYLNLPTNTQRQRRQQQQPNQKCISPAPTCIIMTDDQAKRVLRGEVESHDDDDDDDDDYGTTEPTNLVTVPAVVGRLLRFPGNFLHAVPKPYDRWLEQSDGHGVKGSLPREDDMEEFDDDNDDDDDDDDDSLRSVLLFNTWEDRGPLEVGPDSFATTTMLEGIEMDEDMMAYLAQEQATRIADWQCDFGGVEFDLLKCNPIHEWVDCHPVALVGIARDATAMSEVRMSLMRKENGQLNSKQQLSLYGSSSDVRTALEQEYLVSRIQLQSKKK